MSGNGTGTLGNGQVLCWPRRVLSADDLRRYLTSQREVQLLPRAIVTPLAIDELRSRGIRIRWDAPSAPEATATPSSSSWGYCEQHPDPQVTAAVRALEREARPLTSLEVPATSPCMWARAIGQGLAQGQWAGTIAFCADPALIACVANKVSGVRAAPVWTVAQATRARCGLGANLLAVEMPGRTFFELRQILQACCRADQACPAEVANTLKELDGHAHR